MSNVFSRGSSGGARQRPRELTGRTVLFCLVGFFAVVGGVNAVMMTAAVRTFSGVETANSYQAGVTFAREEAAAEAQSARHWQVSAAIGTPAGGPTRIELSARDRSGRPLTDLQATVRLIHPNDRRHDLQVTMRAEGPGRFSGAAAPPHGQRDLVIELSRNGERLFRSRQRVMIHEGA